MKKYLPFIVVMFLLIGFPLVSWLYLNRGLNYRLEKMEEIKPKATLPDSDLAKFSSRTKWTLLGIADENQREELEEVFTSLRKFYSTIPFVVFQTESPTVLASHQAVVDSLQKVAGVDFLKAPFFFIIDKEGNIINGYHAEKEEEVSRMLEHLAMLIPEEEE